MDWAQQTRNNTLHKIAAIGEVLWDVFDTGPRFGGAPANFACSIASLAPPGSQVEMVSAVGNDELGDSALAELRKHGLGVEYVQQLDFPTGRVDISVNASGNASYEFAENCAWDNLVASPNLMRLAAELDVVCFGTLGQRSSISKSTIQSFVGASSPAALRILDINLRAPFYDESTVRQSLGLANVLKLNDEELPVLAQWLDLEGTETELLSSLVSQFELKAVALTRGEHGALIGRGDEMDECSGVAAQVVDTVGAGDAFTAAWALGLLANEDLTVINRRACEIAAKVCAQRGATPRG